MLTGRRSSGVSSDSSSSGLHIHTQVFTSGSHRWLAREREEVTQCEHSYSTTQLATLTMQHLHPEHHAVPWP